MKAAALEKKLERARTRKAELEAVLPELVERQEAKRQAAGRALADEAVDADLEAARRALAELTAEREATRAAVEFLEEDVARLEGELRSARAAETESAFEDRLQAVRESTGDCRERVRAFLETFLPVADELDAAVEAAGAAFRAARDAKREAGESVAGLSGRLEEARAAGGPGDLYGFTVAARTFAQAEHPVAAAFEALLTSWGRVERVRGDLIPTDPRELRERLEMSR